GLDRGRALQQEKLVLLDDGRRQVLGGEELVARDPERLREPDEEKGVGRRLTPDGVLTTLLDDERDQRALALEVLVRRRVTADRDDLPRRVAKRVEEEAALLADHALQLGAGELAVPDHVEERMVEPGMRVSCFLQELIRERRGRERHPCSSWSPSIGTVGRVSARSFYSLLPARIAVRTATWSILGSLDTGVLVPEISGLFAYLDKTEQHVVEETR